MSRQPTDSPSRPSGPAPGSALMSKPAVGAWAEKRRREYYRRDLARSAFPRTPSRGTSRARDLPSRVSRPLSPNPVELTRRLPYLPMLSLLAAAALVGSCQLPSPLHYARQCLSLSLDEQTKGLGLSRYPQTHISRKWELP